MDEEQFDPRGGFVEGPLLLQVGPDSPIALVEDAIVDPARPRCLQERMGENQHEAPPRLQDAGHLLEGYLEVLHMLEGGAEHHGVEGRVATGEGFGAPPEVPRPPGAPRGGGDLRRSGIQAHDLSTRSRQLPRHLPLPAADVEHPSGTGRVVGHQGEDVVLVFGVGPLGIVPLPPRRVPFPLCFVLHRMRPLDSLLRDGP